MKIEFWLERKHFVEHGAIVLYGINRQHSQLSTRALSGSKCKWSVSSLELGLFLETWRESHRNSHNSHPENTHLDSIRTTEAFQRHVVVYYLSNLSREKE